MDNFLLGFEQLTIPLHLLMLILGVTIGTFIGSMPGLDSSLAITLFVPFTYYMGPFPAIIFIVGAYCGGIYGGSLTSIMFRIPGSVENTAAIFEGNPMAEKGQAGKACGISIFASSFGGIFGTIVLILFAPPLAQIALGFGPAEYFGLTFLGLCMMSAIGAKSRLKGTISTIFGLFIAIVGTSSISSFPRFSFGSAFLMGGIEFIPLLLGLFAMAEIFSSSEMILKKLDIKVKLSAKLPTFKEIFNLRWTYLRASAIGTFIGILPAIGATPASFLSYDIEKRFHKHPEKFGTGVEEGLAGPEAAKNATVGGAFVPLLTLGIPGSATTAIILGAFMIHGIIPGASLFKDNASLVYTIFLSMILANLLILVVGLFEVKNMVKILKIPLGILYPLITLLSIIGSFSIRNSFYDVWFMMIFGIIGYYMRKYDYSGPAVIIGVLLGPVIEKSFLTGMMLFDGNFFMFFHRPISAVCIIASLALLLFPLIKNTASILMKPIK